MAEVRFILYFTHLPVIFASRKILSLENKNKQVLFCILLAYPYFCRKTLETFNLWII